LWPVLSTTGVVNGKDTTLEDVEVGAGVIDDDGDDDEDVTELVVDADSPLKQRVGCTIVVFRSNVEVTVSRKPASLPTAASAGHCPLGCLETIFARSIDTPASKPTPSLSSCEKTVVTLWSSGVHWELVVFCTLVRLRDRAGASRKAATLAENSPSKNSNPRGIRGFTVDNKVPVTEPLIENGRAVKLVFSLFFGLAL